MKSLTTLFLFIFVIGLCASCEPEELNEEVDLVIIGETGNQEDIPDDDKN